MHARKMKFNTTSKETKMIRAACWKSLQSVEVGVPSPKAYFCNWFKFIQYVMPFLLIK